jgi:hypothetical protein
MSNRMLFLQPRKARTPRVGAARNLSSIHITSEENDMGKYFVGWLLGVPVFVLVIAYFFFH